MKINKLLIAFAMFILCSCERGEINVITYKSLLNDNPSLARYHFSTNGRMDVEFIDSANRYQIGDNVKKYSQK
jgi:hypothetical protein